MNEKVLFRCVLPNCKEISTVREHIFLFVSFLHILGILAFKYSNVIELSSQIRSLMYPSQEMSNVVKTYDLLATNERHQNVQK